jgi:hypothetical protein
MAAVPCTRGRHVSRHEGRTAVLTEAALGVEPEAALGLEPKTRRLASERRRMVIADVAP